MQQTPATPESPASPPCSGSSTDSAGGVDRSAARILMQLNHNYMKMDDSVANNHGSELATDSAAPAAAAMAPMPPPQQPPQQQQQLQPPPKQQKKLLPNGALFSTGGTICLEPYAAAAVAAQASRSAAATVKAINKSGNLQVKISRFPSTSPYQRPQNQVRQSPSASNVLNQQYQQQRTLLTATATTASSAGQSSHPQSSTSSTDSTTTNTTTTSAPSKRAVRVRTQDPSTHRESEKRRRERFNTSLTDLRELVPRNFVSKSCQNKVRLEKTEVINSAIAYIKFLKANAATGAVNNRNGYRLSPEAHLAWKEEDFKKRAGVIFNDDIFYPNHVISGGQSILARSTGGEQEGQQQQQQPLTTASDLLQDLSNGGSGSRSRHGSCASSGSATTAYSLEELSPFNSTRRGSGGGEDSFMAGQSQPQQQQMSMLTENSCPISPIVPIGGSGRVVYYLQPHQISHLQQQQQQQQMIKSETGEDSGISISDHMYHAMSPPVVVVSSAAASGNTINTNTNTNNIVNRSGTNGYNLFSL